MKRSYKIKAIDQRIGIMKHNLFIFILITSISNNYLHSTAAKKRNLQTRQKHLEIINASLLQKIHAKAAGNPFMPPTLALMLCPTKPPKDQSRGSHEKKRLQQAINTLISENRKLQDLHCIVAQIHRNTDLLYFLTRLRSS